MPALNTDLELMHLVSGQIDARNQEVRAMLGTFIGRMCSVPASVWGGAAAVRFREVVDRWNAEVAGVAQRPGAHRRHHSAQRARPCARPRKATRTASAPSATSCRAGVGHMDMMLTYNFDEIEYTVRQEIHTTSARFNAALEELRAQIAPLQQTWTAEAAEAYRTEQLRWNQSAAALSDILFRLGNAVREGTDDVSATDRRAASAWAASRRPTPMTLCGPASGERPAGPHSRDNAARRANSIQTVNRQLSWSHALVPALRLCAGSVSLVVISKTTGGRVPPGAGARRP